MTSSSKSAVILLFLLVTGIWFLGEKLFHALHVLFRGVRWGVKLVWNLGSPATLPPEPKEETKPKKKKKKKN